MSEAKLITISMDEYKRLDALRARVAELDGEFKGHTPGPWMKDFLSASGRCQVVSPTRYSICTLVNNVYMAQGESEANAQLIAAAPDLLAERNQLRARVNELEAKIAEQRRLRDYFGDRMARLDAAAREAMILLDQQKPRPEAAFGVLLCALNPDLPSAKRATLEGK